MAQSREYKNYLRRCRRLRPDVKAKEKEYADRYRANHPDYVERHRESQKRYFENNRTIAQQKIIEYNSRSCRDPVAGDVCRYNTLVNRKRTHPDWYEGVVPKDCLVKVPTIKGMDEQLKKEYNMV